MNESTLASLCVTPHEFARPGHGDSARTGALLVHGMTGTPTEMQMLAKGLNREGFTVYAVQLAGHCGTVDDLMQTRWQDWLASVESGLARLSGQVDRVVVVGLSMGALLALLVAASSGRQIAGVCARSPTLRLDGWSLPAYSRLAFLLPLCKSLGIGRNRLFMEAPPYGIKDQALRQRIVEKMRSGHSAQAGLPGNPWWTVLELRRLSAHVRSRLSQIHAPTLVMHARDDDMSDVSNAHDIMRGLVNAETELVLLEDSYHMITIDRERRTVIARVNDFVKRIDAGR